MSTYKKLIGPFVLKVTEEDEILNLEFIFEDSDVDIPRYTILTEQILMVGMIRKATGLQIKPIKVASIYDYGDGVIEDYFGVKAEKCDKNILRFKLEDMQEPFITSNNAMWNYLEPELKKRIKEIEVDKTYAARVRSTLVELISAGEDRVETVAYKLAVSTRTLQRKLSSENTSFIKQLNHTKELMARNYLKDKSISNDEIAFLLGYSDATAFGRAFRTWTGVTIGFYRKANY
jgi:AraC-like DNA-binding protein